MTQGLHSSILHAAIAKLSNDDPSMLLPRPTGTLLGAPRRQVLLGLCLRFDQLTFPNCLDREVAA